MTKAEIVNAIINAFVAVGTIAVAILAIWGDWVRYRLGATPRPRLAAHNHLRGSVIPLGNSGRSAIYYHLEVVNSRGWAAAVNCRVTLKKMWRQVANNAFQEIHLTIPLTFAWSPAEATSDAITVSHVEVMDFGSVVEHDDHFGPKLRWYPGGFLGNVHANEVIRFGMEIVGDNFMPQPMQVFEVAWNGQWTDNLETMRQHLQIREVIASE